MDERPLDRPPRWGLYFFLFCALIFAIVFGSYLVWTIGASNRLDKQVALYKSAGEPIELADLAAASFPDVDNAAVALRDAARIDQTTANWQAYDRLDLDLPLRPNEITAIRAVVADNSASFDAIDDAMGRKGLDWQILMRSPLISVLLPDLNQQRTLASLVAARAMLEFQDGDHAAAIADLHRVLFIGRAIGQQPTLVSHLVSVGIGAIVTSRAQRMSPDLKIGNAKGDASPQQMKQLIAELLDDGPQRASFKRGFQGERAIELDTARCIANGTLTFSSIATMGGSSKSAGLAPVLGFVARPIAYDDALIMIRQSTGIIAAYEKSPDFPSFKKNAPPPPLNGPTVRHALVAILMPSFDRSVQSDFRITADRRMTAIVLAIRWYAIDHGGKLPAKLSDLVPQYLPAIPADPMASGSPIKFIPNPAKPIVYSVGENGIDDGGSEATKQTIPDPDKWLMADAVVRLKPAPRKAPEEEVPDDGVGGLSARTVATTATAPTTPPSTQP